MAAQVTLDLQKRALELNSFTKPKTTFEALKLGLSEGYALASVRYLKQLQEMQQKVDQALLAAKEAGL